MKILVSALEASANLHLSHVIKELEKHEKIELCGIFELEGYSGALHKSSEFGAMGFVEVLGLIAKAKRALKKNGRACKRLRYRAANRLCCL